MGIKTFRPTTPSRRNMTALTYDEITKSSPEKSTRGFGFTFTVIHLTSCFLFSFVEIQLKTVCK